MDHVLCHICQKRPSTVHITEIEAGTPTTMHVCESCAHEQRLIPSAHPNQSSLLGLLKSVVSQELIAKSLSTGALAGLPELESLFADDTSSACPTCGITLKEFRQTGRFGCPEDYTVFRNEVETLVERIHGARVHVGVVPAGGDTRTQRRAQLMRLRTQLDDAVAREAFEEAARLRDEIQALDAELGSPERHDAETDDASPEQASSGDGSTDDSAAD